MPFNLQKTAACGKITEWDLILLDTQTMLSSVVCLGLKEASAAKALQNPVHCFGSVDPTEPQTVLALDVTIEKRATVAP